MEKTIAIILAGMILATALSITAAAFAKKALEPKQEAKPDELMSNPLVYCKHCAYYLHSTGRCVLTGRIQEEDDGCTDGERKDDA